MYSLLTFNFKFYYRPYRFIKNEAIRARALNYAYTKSLAREENKRRLIQLHGFRKRHHGI